MSRNRIELILAANSSQARKEIQGFEAQAKNSFAGIAKSIAGVAAAYMSYRAISSTIRESIRLAGEQEVQERRLEAVLQATGNAAGYSSDQLKSMAADLQKVTTFGDEATIGGMAMLATFKQIKGDEFGRATRAAQDMAVVMGGGKASAQGLESAVMQIGKALQEPIQGMTALTRSGITFTEAQKEQVRALIESGRAQDAQRLILAELESQFKGAASAARDTFAGSMQAAGNAFGDLQEEIGFVITKNQVFIDLIKASEERFAVWGAYLSDNRERLQRLATDGFMATANAAIRMAKVLLAGGAAYLAITGLPVIAASAATAVNVLRLSIAGLFTEVGVLKAGAFSQALFGVKFQVSSLTTAMGLLRTVTLGAFAAFAGWQLGKWLSDEFEAVRVAGVLMVGGLNRGWIEVKYAAEIAWEGVKAAFFAVTDSIRNRLSTMLGWFSDGFNAIGAVDTSVMLNNLAVGMKAGQRKAFVDTTKEILAERKKELEEHFATTNAMLAENAIKVNDLAPGPRAPKAGKAETEGAEIGGALFVTPDLTGGLDAQKAVIEDFVRLQEDVKDRIARLTLDETDYKILQLNRWYDAAVATAEAAGMDTLEIERAFALQKAELDAAALEAVREHQQQEIALIWETAEAKLASEHQVMDAMRESWGLTWEEIRQGSVNAYAEVANAAANATQMMASNLTDVAVGAKSADEAAKALFQGIARSAVSTLIQIGGQRLILSALQKTTVVGEAAAQAGAMSVIAAAAAPAAMLTSIATAGGAAAAGAAAFTAAMGSMSGVALATATAMKVSAATPLATGTITTGPVFAQIGEDGQEAVVPLSPKYRSQGRRIFEEIAPIFAPQMAEGGLAGRVPMGSFPVSGNSNRPIIVNAHMEFTGPIRLDADASEVKDAIGRHIDNAVRGALN